MWDMFLISPLRANFHTHPRGEVFPHGKLCLLGVKILLLSILLNFRERSPPGVNERVNFDPLAGMLTPGGKVQQYIGANFKPGDKLMLLKTCVSRGRCYDHNFLRFSPIFGEKIGVFLKNQCYDQFFSQTSSSLSKKRQYFRWIFGENILKIITSVPGRWFLIHFFRWIFKGI
jgi:hypothetical protein